MKGQYFRDIGFTFEIFQWKVNISEILALHSKYFNERPIFQRYCLYIRNISNLMLISQKYWLYTANISDIRTLFRKHKLFIGNISNVKPILSGYSHFTEKNFHYTTKFLPILVILKYRRIFSPLLICL